MKCPTCHQPTIWENNSYRPFCCERCQMLDLGLWVTERYRIDDELVLDDAVADSPNPAIVASTSATRDAS